MFKKTRYIASDLIFAEDADTARKLLRGTRQLDST